MQLSKSTIEVLENFAAINSAILIRPGNRLVSIANSGGVLVNAEILDSFTGEFGVYDLKTFLSLASLVGDDAYLEINDKGYVVIQNAEKKPSTRYRFFMADKSLIKTPPKDELIIEERLSFKLNTQLIKKILQAISILALDNIAITSIKNNLYLGTADPKRKDTDSFSILLNDDYNGPEVNLLFAKEKFNFLQGDYNCSVGFKPTVLQLTHKDRDLRYWIAAESKSTINGE